MRVLLRLFPAEWRSRYEDEFVDLLHHHPALSASDVIDIMLAALDARLRCATVAPSHPSPSAFTTVRGHRTRSVSGWALILAGVTTLAPLMLAQIPLIPTLPVASVLLTSLTGLVLSALGSLGLRTAFQRQALGGTQGSLGLTLIFASSVLAIGLAIVSTSLHPAVVLPMSLLVTLIFNLAWLFTAVTVFRQGSFSRLIPLPLAIGSIQGVVGVALVSFALLTATAGSTAALGWITLANPLVSAGWILLGLALREPPLIHRIAAPA